MRSDDTWLPHEPKLRIAADAILADTNRTIWGVGVDWDNRLVLVQLAESTLLLHPNVAMDMGKALVDGAACLRDGTPYQWIRRAGPEAPLVIAWDGGDDTTLLVGAEPSYLFPTAEEAHVMGEDLEKAAMDLKRGGGTPPSPLEAA